MPLELHPLQEADLAAAVEVMWQSFKPDIMGCIWPHGITQAARDYTIAKGLESWRKSPEKIKKMKVIDTDLPDDDPLGKIIGYSDWYFYPKQRTEEELKEKEGDGGDDDLPPDCDKEMLREFGGQLDAAKRDYIGGRPYIELHILVTHPKHHRRGVGAMQLRWGFEHAEKLGLPVYLESSPIGRPLYAREGFEALGVLPFDARKFGFEKELQHTLMLRPVKGKVDATTRLKVGRTMKALLTQHRITPFSRDRTGEKMAPASHERGITEMSPPTGPRHMRRTVSFPENLTRYDPPQRTYPAGCMRPFAPARLGGDADGTTPTAMALPWDLGMSAEALVERTGNAEGALRLINDVVRLSAMRYGQPILQSKHIRGMLVDGELDWIAASLSPGLAQALRAATKQHDATFTFPAPPQIASGNAQTELVRTGAHALGESSALRHDQAGTKRKAGEYEDTLSDYSDSDAEQQMPRRSSRGESLQIISLLAGYPVVSMEQHPYRFVEMLCDRLIDRCAVYEASRKYSPANRKPPSLVYRGRNRHDRRINWDRTEETGMRATLEAAFAKKPCCPCA
ncbi:hypothetical protein LTR27_011604 [Elasticomyces elasticus]|nr:hypothetical protein LTR27_011604 [Elasticomyces elasticus]